MHTVYILYSEIKDRFYTGATSDLSKRLSDHNSGRNKSTKSGIPWILKHTEFFSTLGEARSRESEIKRKKSRKYIEYLIAG